MTQVPSTQSSPVLHAFPMQQSCVSAPQTANSQDLSASGTCAIVSSTGAEKEEKHTLAHGGHGGVRVVADEASVAGVDGRVSAARFSIAAAARRRI